MPSSFDLVEIIIFVIILLAVTVYLIWTLYAFYIKRRIDRAGLIADGKIVNRSQKYIGRRPLPETQYFINYAFAVGISGVDQKTFNGSQRVSETAYNKTGIGDRIEALYLPRNPNISRLVDNRRRHDQTAKRKSC